ncbi:hypothetical protein BDY24DRAFT_383013 [Mrakia frigida]|uniref:uncharacterized protein n=1 Tax=Mrakia frigida TaxID=29902 RepID=UPI003FCC229B
MWPAGSGLVFLFDNRTPLSVLLLPPLSLFFRPQRHTNQTFPYTQWIEDATHVLIDTKLPSSTRDRDRYEGKISLSLDWIRDSIFDGQPADENDDKYRVLWKKEPKEERRFKVKKEEKGTGGVAGVAKAGTKRGMREEREEDDESYENNDDGPLVKMKTNTRWTDEENRDYARYIVANPQPNWKLWLESHPGRSLDAIKQHHYQKRNVIDPLIERIKREANGQPVVYVHPTPASASSSSSRPNLAQRPKLEAKESEDTSDESSVDEAASDARRSPSFEPNKLRFVPSSSGLPCVNCKCKTATVWHRLKEIDTGEQQFCGGCRGVFYHGNVKSFREGKEALARRKKKVLGSDASDLDSDDDDEQALPRDASHHDSSSRPSLPNTSSSHHSSSHHRISLPPNNSASSSYLAPPAPPKRSHSSTSNREDFDPRLEKRRKKHARMGASTSASTSTSYNPSSSSNFNPNPNLNAHHPSSFNSPAPPPSANPFLTVGTKPSHCTTNRWCWLCGTTESERYSMINLREQATDGMEEVETVSRVVCGGCSSFRKERRTNAMDEEELLELSRKLTKRGEGIRRRTVEGEAGR